jgi:hypothetical protein
MKIIILICACLALAALAFFADAGANRSTPLRPDPSFGASPLYFIADDAFIVKFKLGSD